jgi:glycosyltransferase involved in cell wall biosynthesis
LNEFFILQHNKPSETSVSLISIVTVVFNGVDEIESTILSVINQNYSNIEYIVIDGGSTDGTVDIINKYKDSISHIVSEKDDGIYDAMNKSLLLVTGDWVNFMNSGDSFYSDSAISSINFYTCESEVLYGSTNVVYSEYMSKIVKPVSTNYVSTMPFSHQSCFVRSNVMKDYKFDWKRFRIIADKYFFQSLAKNGGTFKKVDLVISNSDVSCGVSNVFSIQMEKEQILVGTICRKHFILIYLANIPIRLGKSIIKLVIPKHLLDKLRSMYGLTR